MNSEVFFFWVWLHLPSSSSIDMVMRYLWALSSPAWPGPAPTAPPQTTDTAAPSSCLSLFTGSLCYVHISLALGSPEPGPALQTRLTHAESMGRYQQCTLQPPRTAWALLYRPFCRIKALPRARTWKSEAFSSCPKKASSVPCWQAACPDTHKRTAHVGQTQTSPSCLSLPEKPTETLQPSSPATYPTTSWWPQGDHSLASRLLWEPVDTFWMEALSCQMGIVLN